MPTGIYKRKREDIEKLIRNSGNPKGNKLSEETKRKISESHKKIGSPWNKGNSWNVGRKRPISERRKISETLIKNREKSHLWKGGITPINKAIRHSFKYRIWRESVFKRDNWTCVLCGARAVRINADHIKPFAFFPRLRFAISNGRTLCEPCHRKTDTWKRPKVIK